MVTLLSRIFVKENCTDLRKAYGMLCSVLGICLNVLLFAGKYFAGVISGSIAITADAFNNLSDAGSSFITLVGFRLAGKEPDSDHPFGHGRFEYISGFMVSIAIVVMGFELFKSSVVKIFKPEDVDTSTLTIVILVASILVKLYMFFYNRKVGAKINSAAMKATSVDSLSDSVATSVVLLSVLIMRFAHINLDGICGLMVACFILYAGYNAAKDTISPLLGSPPSPEFVKEIEELVMAHTVVSGIHDLVVHDYGPGRLMISLHAEVDGKGDVFALHDEIDLIERELRTALGCQAVIHMDPVERDNEIVSELRKKMAGFAKELSPEMTIHDFRIVQGTSHTNIIFDVVLPYDSQMTKSQVHDKFEEFAKTINPDYYVVIDVDRAYV